MADRPQAVGILAMEVFLPSGACSQADLELRVGVPGKYTVGLGQQVMSFVSDREDAVSMALSVTQALLHRWTVNPEAVGRLEVGKPAPGSLTHRS